MFKPVRCSALAVGFAMAAASCGHDGGGSTPPSDRLLIDLTQSDMRALCRIGDELGRDSITSEHGFCMAYALGDARFSCDDAYDECIAGDLYGVRMNHERDCTDVVREMFVTNDACEATVADWEDCMRELLPAMSERTETAACTDSIDEEFNQIDPPACAKLSDC